MAALNYLPAFEDDALAIWTHIAEDNPAAADELIDKLYARCLLLIDHPLAGPARPDIAKGCRHLTLGRYLILYRYEKGQIDLVRALDSRRKISGEMFRTALT
jgi:toxin ParE1/3/4